ncbi:hypothetical protein VTO42DRAFT_3630 [Malbranchea cinnamomea]
MRIRSLGPRLQDRHTTPRLSCGHFLSSVSLFLQEHIAVRRSLAMIPQPFSLQTPSISVPLNFNCPLLTKRNATCMQDCGRRNRVLQRWQPTLIQRYLPFVECRDSIDEFLEADVSVPGLAAKISFFVWCVAHIEWVVPNQLALTFVVGNIISSLCLVNADFPL